MSIAKSAAALSVLSALALLAGCSAVEHAPKVHVSCSEKWVILPMENFTETPHAAQAAETLAENILRSQGVGEVAAYPAALADSLADFGTVAQKYSKALDWARGQEAHYGVTGSVTEWRYKSGTEGEPVAGMTLRIIDIETGKSVWTTGGAKTGWDRDAITGVAQKLIRTLLRTALSDC